uniref:Uncharacterized protein n=1 Tax=viral metagenome TaxID=1070528 RepID=A0A6M3LVZ3_9ZZZZ
MSINKTCCGTKPISIQDLRPSKQYQWKPQLDITTYELALAIPILCASLFNSFDMESILMSLPEEVRRHLEEIKEKL